MRTRVFAVATLAFLLVATGAAAEPDDAAYRRLNQALVERHIVPRYARLAAATGDLTRSAEAFCENPKADALEALRGAFVVGLGAWQDVQHVQFGPVELSKRSTRLAFWPDPRGVASARRLAELLRARDPRPIAPEAFARGSFTVQGFPTLEHLLFAESALEALLATDPGARFRCDLIRAVARNLAAMASDIWREWTTGEPSFAQVVANPGPASPRYRDAKEATLDLFKSVYAAVERVADHKVARPLGPSAEAARPDLAESRVSRRSLDNIRRNLEAAAAMYRGDGGDGFSGFVRDTAGDGALDDLLRLAFAQTLGTADSITRPLESAVSDPQERPKVVQLAREVTALKQLLAYRLTAALGIPLGFNALDGD